MHTARAFGAGVLISIVVIPGMGILLAASLTASEQPGTSARATVVVIRGARLSDSLGGEPMARAIDRVEGDRLYSVAFPLPVPARAPLLGLGDSTLLPGLTDLHTHLAGRRDIL